MDIEKKRARGRKWAREHKEYNREYYRKWYMKNGRNRAVDYQEAIIEWRKKHPEAVRARGKVQYAIITGKIKKPTKCSNCNREIRLSAHHNDYSKPLEVLWLCSSCHKLIHSSS